jgi:hypothetical protein
LQSLKKKMEKNNSICALQADFALIFTGGNWVLQKQLPSADTLLPVQGSGSTMTTSLASYWNSGGICL